MSRSSNFRLTCICAFADAKRKAKLARKLHKKGAVGDHPSNFRDKINIKLKRVLDCIYFIFNITSSTFLLNSCCNSSSVLHFAKISLSNSK